jgi:radical SAM superfamily enzyme YgiQ (UPF0313 family)
VLQKNKNVDYILCGEADQTILQFIHAFFESKNPHYSEIPNLAYRADGEINCTESYTPVNLDELPLPARHLIDLQKYNVGNIIVNRGCPYDCAFCVRQKIFQKVRYRAISDITHEMQVLSRLGFQFINLYDNLNISEEFSLNLCKKVEMERIDVNWGCELRADKVCSELAQSLKRAGCKVIAVGVESGDSRILQRINKLQDLKRVKKGINLAKSAGLAVQAYFVIGLPGETQDSFTLTRQFLDELPLEPGEDRVNFFAATPYPGTALYEHPGQFGIQILHENWDLYDNEHLILKLNSVEFPELEGIFEQAKEIEKNFSS